MVKPTLNKVNKIASYTRSSPRSIMSSRSDACSKPDMSYLPTFNIIGGRPDERRGTQGSFKPGVRIMSGGPARDVPLEADQVDRGTVLFVSSTLKPDMSGQARTNATRPDERLGSHGRFSPGSQRRWLGGAPRDVPVERDQVDRGTVLFVSSTLKPDVSGEARANAVRPDERLGSRGGFTPGARRWLGGLPRDIPLPRMRPEGTVLFESAACKPDLSGEGQTNVSGGRDDERQGRMGSFEHGIVEAAGGPLHMPSASKSALWSEAGQRKENAFRRCGPGHFVAGVSILSGGMPVY